MTARHVVLVGLMASGKTTVGRLVAQRLGRPFVDSDAAIEARAGRTVRDIWLDDGEPAFRKMETEALQDALDAADPSVIAAAGGVVIADANRTALRSADATVIWLDADPAMLVQRAKSGRHRPLLDADPEAALHAMASAREALYRGVADVTVVVGSRTPGDIADEIVALVGDG